MIREEAEQYLYCAMSVGEQLLVNGAEVGRVEDTIRRICMAYGASRVDVFSITSSIVTTMYGEDMETYTQTRRVSAMPNDLHKLDELNRLSRKICAVKPAPEEIKRELENIRCGPKYTFVQQLFIYALVSGSFSVLFGGDWKDMAASAVIGVLLKFFEAVIKKASANRLLTALLCSTAGGFLANFAVGIGFGSHADLISIGNVMLFIPGLAFTNSLRDMFSGDTVTALVRFMESVLMAIIIALGFTLANLL